MKRSLKWAALAAAAVAVLATGCQSVPTTALETVPHVDLKRFMGDWYVIANIPPFIEKGAHNSVESYQLDADGTVAIAFNYRDGAVDGAAKRITSRGFVQDSVTNAIWGVQFIWPIKADYRIVHLSDDYSQVIVGREKRDYVWVMARTPQVSEADYKRLISVVTRQGYDVRRIQKVPQKWN